MTEMWDKPGVPTVVAKPKRLGRRKQRIADLQERERALAVAGSWPEYFSAEYEKAAADILEDREIARKRADRRRREVNEKPSLAALAAVLVHEYRDAETGSFQDFVKKLEKAAKYEASVKGGDPDYLALHVANFAWVTEPRWAIPDKLTRLKMSDILEKGLKSKLHPILKLFVSYTRKTRKLRVGNDKGSVWVPTSKLYGLDQPYVETNGWMRGVIRMDMDSNLSRADIVALCQKAGVPLPNICVGDGDETTWFVRPHLLWLLTTPVDFESENRSTKPIGLLRGVQRGLCAALGADPGALMNCLKIKNPVSHAWGTMVLSASPYALSNLAATVNTSTKLADLGIGGRNPGPDHSDPEVAGQSNGAFAAVSAVSNNLVRAYRDHGHGDIGELADHLTDLAMEWAGTGPAAQRAARKLAVGCAEWSWLHIERKKTPKEIRDAERAGALKAAAVKTKKTAAAVAAMRETIEAEGGKATRVAVAARLEMDRNSVSRVWNVDRKCGVRVRYVKEGDKRDGPLSPSPTSPEPVSLAADRSKFRGAPPATVFVSVARPRCFPPRQGRQC